MDLNDTALGNFHIPEFSVDLSASDIFNLPIKPINEDALFISTESSTIIEENLRMLEANSIAMFISPKEQLLLNFESTIELAKKTMVSFIDRINKRLSSYYDKSDGPMVIFMNFDASSKSSFYNTITELMNMTICFATKNQNLPQSSSIQNECAPTIFILNADDPLRSCALAHDHSFSSNNNSTELKLSLSEKKLLRLLNIENDFAYEIQYLSSKNPTASIKQGFEPLFITFNSSNLSISIDNKHISPSTVIYFAGKHSLKGIVRGEECAIYLSAENPTESIRSGESDKLWIIRTDAANTSITIGHMNKPPFLIFFLRTQFCLNQIKRKDEGVTSTINSNASPFVSECMTEDQIFEMILDMEEVFGESIETK